ncbi:MULTISPECIES: sensor domain-containing protein [unclassified Rhodanobacter]|uniref:EAL domain-containing protein n=1 Tax=Rhodanobacter humi TaxID=1888173 RepID=A0ABV4ASY6_9GAMM
MSTAVQSTGGDGPASAFPPELAEHVLRNAPALIACIDTELRFRYVNDTHRRWFGTDPAQLIGRRLSEALDVQSYLAARAALLQALGGQPSHYEGELASGTVRRYVHGHFQPDLDAAGRVRGVITVFTDITERHALELQLRESEQRFFQAFQHAAIGMALVHPDGQFMRVNAALCAMLGYADHELLAHNWRDITHPDDLASSEALARQLLDGGREAFHTEKRYLHRDGHAVHVQLSVSQVRDDAGRLRYVVTQVQDISQRRHFEDTLFRERQLAEATLSSIGDAVLTTDPGLHVTSLNPIAEAMTGWSASEAKGRRMDEVFRLRDADSGAELANPLREAIRRDAIVNLSGKVVLAHRNGFETPIEDSAAPIHDHAGNVIGGVLVCHDVSENRALALKMIHLTQHDTLTGLPNRNLLPVRIEQAVHRAALHDRRCALLYLDMDHFRRINEALGYEGGDQVMQAVAQGLRETLREDETLYRYNGDEFVLLLPRVDEACEATVLAERLLHQCARIALPGVASLQAGASIGVSVFPDDADDADALLRHAGTAMYEMKVAGRGGWRRYTAAMGERAATLRNIEGALRDALAHDALALHYQPMVDARSGRIVGAEALLRWQVDGHDVFMPDQFIPVAEDSGLIAELGEWVLQRACMQSRHWRQRGRLLPISVNVSPLQFRHERFQPQLDALLGAYGIGPGQLELELTERTMMAGGDATTRLLQRIRQHGVRLSLDDFGTGYCSLSYLRHFPVDALKIDRSFVHDVTADSDTAAITRTIVAMARSLGKTVIAEGVETAAQADFLREAGCTLLQGFHFGMPMPAAELERWMAASAA